ncbi:hypothetical protein [Streptomyces sp. NRRL F-5727]|uniref:hypothetical protein n=1 Tax=Streptomyces sp. NRRL F-5727 TaxID=1463871 RepID=UPI0004C8333A|nr:hypothetical protein [Streptomyces sp. NRRL F-5727]
MRMRRRTVALAAAAAALAIPATAGSAQAVTPNSEVYLTTTYAKVVAGWTWRADRLDPVMMSVQDTNPDGYAVAFRLVTLSDDQGYRYWGYRYLTSGAGTGVNVTTYAITGYSPKAAWVEVCKYKSGAFSDCRKTATTYNPIDDSSVSGT